MAKVDLTNSQTEASVEQFIDSVEHPQRQADARRLLSLFRDVTVMPAKMWGSQMIGFGRYEYKYASGREGEYFITGFSPRKQNLAIYIMPGYHDLSEQLAKLGKHKLGKSCLYIQKLADVDTNVLADLVRHGVAEMKKKYPTHNE